MGPDGTLMLFFLEDLMSVVILKLQAAFLQVLLQGGRFESSVLQKLNA